MSDVIVYLDETGDHSLELVDKDFPLFAISMFIAEKEIYNLTSGPGKVCKAFGFSKEHSGLDLTNSSVFIVNQPKIKKDVIGISKRIGITKSVNLPWRFFEIGNLYLSR